MKNFVVVPLLLAALPAFAQAPAAPEVSAKIDSIEKGFAFTESDGSTGQLEACLHASDPKKNVTELGKRLEEGKSTVEKGYAEYRFLSNEANPVFEAANKSDICSAPADVQASVKALYEKLQGADDVIREGCDTISGAGTDFRDQYGKKVPGFLKSIFQKKPAPNCVQTKKNIYMIADLLEKAVTSCWRSETELQNLRASVGSLVHDLERNCLPEDTGKDDDDRSWVVDPALPDWAQCTGGFWHGCGPENKK